jgi:hypothetical protein
VEPARSDGASDHPQLNCVYSVGDLPRRRAGIPVAEQASYETFVCWQNCWQPPREDLLAAKMREENVSATLIVIASVGILGPPLRAECGVASAQQANFNSNRRGSSTAKRRG